MNNKKIVFIALGISVIILVLAFLEVKKSASPEHAVNIEELRGEILAEARNIGGIIKNTSIFDGGFLITVDTQLADISQLNSRGSVPQITKRITIFVGPKILIKGTSTPQIGDTVAVTLDKSVYEGERFNALEIAVYNYAGETKRQVTEADRIHGEIRSLKGNMFILRARVADITKIDTVDFSGTFTVPQVTKDYKIMVASTTQFMGGTNKDLKVGGTVIAWEDNILYKDSFTADKLFIEQ